MATAPPERTPKTGRRPRRRARPRPMRIVETTPTMTVSHRQDAKARDLGERDLDAEQGDAGAQHGPRAKFDAGDAAAFLMQEMEGHAEQQGEQHDRRRILLGEPGRGQGDGAGDQHAGINRMQQSRLRQRSKELRRRRRLDCGDPFHTVEGIVGNLGPIELAPRQATPPNPPRRKPKTGAAPNARCWRRGASYPASTTQETSFVPRSSGQPKKPPHSSPGALYSSDLGSL